MASSSSHGSAGTISISNISSLISLKLDRDNYLLWKVNFCPLHNSTSTVAPPATALYTSTSSGRSSSSSSRGRLNRGCGRGCTSNSQSSSSTQYAPKQNSRPTCQICNRLGHSAIDCFNRLDLSFQGRQPPEKLQAMAAAKLGESTWFTDTGATNHVTSDLSNLSLHSDYVGNASLVVGSGKRNGEDPLPRADP